MKFGELIKLYDCTADKLIDIAVEDCKTVQSISPKCRPVIEGLKDMTVTGFCFDDGTLLVYLEEGGCR